MVVARDYKSFIKAREELSGSVGFVPTMGALHEGHLSLIKRAKEENDFVVVSIFVNPTQFLEGEDFSKYPRREEADIQICKLAGVDILFMPDTKDIYTKDEPTLIAPKIRGYILEGAKRPGHFNGVLQIVMKLLNLVNPTKAYFGKKDAQQLILIEQMVKTYFMKSEIIGCEIVRDRDGLALSSRNIYLSPDERKRALTISKSLKRAAKLIQSGELDSSKIIEQMEHIMQNEVNKIEYIAVTNRALEPIKRVELGNSIILVAVRVGKTRLIDNIWI